MSGDFYIKAKVPPCFSLNMLTGYTQADDGKRRVIEEEENSEAERGSGQQYETDVARNHEVPHDQRHFVLVHAVPLWGRRGVLTTSHTPLRAFPKVRQVGKRSKNRLREEG
ncbi:hypothetical protein DPX16_20491 [Anabarilius grahami]|uniref:Uncharacterized protein n=1 Tax=Anabarilius grahami TaxID=495550 RepID=A0A3N0YKY7_ANAGA|nr:hypothetical protein DPX16_20491 [Anabarilius grahami]